VKILLVHNTYQHPGGEDIVFGQERRLLERAGHQVTTFCRTNWDVDDYKGLRKFNLAQRTIWCKDARDDMAKLLAKNKPDVVHVHNTFVMISPSIYSACAEANVPVVLTVHNYRLLCPAATFFRNGKVCEECMHSLLPSIQHACYHNSRAATAVIAGMLMTHRMRRTWEREISCFVALSQFERNKLIEGGLPGDKIFVKPNFVYPDPGTRADERKYALFAGRLSPEKRVSTVIAAWKRLRTPIPLRIVGSGPDRAELEADVARHGLTNVRFDGQLSHEQTLAAINNARFMIIPSEWYETFCMAITESFACGTPVICSRMGVMQELVADRRTGFHYTPSDAADLAQKVEWAWAHPDELLAMGKQARTEFEAKYTAEQNYSILMNIYQRASESLQ